MKRLIVSPSSELNLFDVQLDKWAPAAKATVAAIGCQLIFINSDYGDLREAA